MQSHKKVWINVYYCHRSDPKYVNGKFMKGLPDPAYEVVFRGMSSTRGEMDRCCILHDRVIYL